MTRRSRGQDRGARSRACASGSTAPTRAGRCRSPRTAPRRRGRAVSPSRARCPRRCWRGSVGRRRPALRGLCGPHATRRASPGTVGAMMAVLMGVRAPDMVARACDLGVAMQLTNIARDVGEDARAAGSTCRWDGCAKPESSRRRGSRGRYSAHALGAVVQRLLRGRDESVRARRVRHRPAAASLPARHQRGAAALRRDRAGSRAARVAIRFRAAPWCPRGARRGCSGARS